MPRSGDHSVRVICFRRDRTKEVYEESGRPPAFSLVVKEKLIPFREFDPDEKIQIETLPDTHIGSSDGSVAIYAHPGEILIRDVWIGINEWEDWIARGRKWRPVKSIAAILTEAFGVGLNALDHLLPKTQQESYYDGDIWRMLDDLFYAPFRQGGHVYDTLWVRPQPADWATGRLHFRLIVRRRAPQCVESGWPHAS